MSRILVLLTFLLTLAPGCAIVQVGVRNPVPGLETVAIVPFFNLSQDRTVDGREFALAYYAELQKVPGFEVIPIGVVERAIQQHGLAMAGPEDALKLAQLLNVDAVVIGSVTDHDPYIPRVGLKVSWYSPKQWLMLPDELFPMKSAQANVAERSRKLPGERIMYGAIRSQSPDSQSGLGNGSDWIRQVDDAFEEPVRLGSSEQESPRRDHAVEMIEKTRPAPSQDGSDQVVGLFDEPMTPAGGMPTLPSPVLAIEEGQWETVAGEKQRSNDAGQGGSGGSVTGSEVKNVPDQSVVSESGESERPVSLESFLGAGGEALSDSTKSEVPVKLKRDESNAEPGFVPADTTLPEDMPRQIPVIEDRAALSAEPSFKQISLQVPVPRQQEPSRLPGLPPASGSLPTPNSGANFGPSSIDVKQGSAPGWQLPPLEGQPPGSAGAASLPAPLNSFEMNGSVAGSDGAEEGLSQPAGPLALVVNDVMVTAPDDFDPRQPLMAYVRMFDSTDQALVSRLSDYLELSGETRTGDLEAWMKRSDFFRKFTAHVMISEMLTLHGGEARRRLVIKPRKYR